MRKLAGVISALGVLAGVCGYVGSYYGLTTETLGLYLFVFVGGVVLVYIPIHIAELPRSMTRRFWQDVHKQIPNWTRRVIQAVVLLCAVHLLIFLFRSHLASPQIVNGEYVLNNRGRIEKVLTRDEYFSLKGDELRVLAAGGVFLYMELAAYWFLVRKSDC